MDRDEAMSFILKSLHLLWHKDGSNLLITGDQGQIQHGAHRQAPDVIVLGEIRDAEIMNFGMEFAQTGHLAMAKWQKKHEGV